MDKVSWAMKNWDQFTDEDKKALGKHLLELKKERGRDRAKEYCLYLSNYCGAPRDSLYDHIGV